MGSDFFGKAVLDNLPLLWDGFQLTIWLSVLSCIVSLVLGTVIAILRVQPLGPLRAFAVGYVEFFRNTPLLIQLFFFYHALPKAGISLSGFESAMWGLSIYTAAFVAETVRAGILSIHRGQMEAARSLGFGYVDAMRYIVLPQAFSIIIPPLGTLFIALIKNTSLASTIAVGEVLYQGEVLEGRTFRTLEILSAVGVFYLVLTLPLGYLVNQLEVRMGRFNSPAGRAQAASTSTSRQRGWGQRAGGWLRVGLSALAWLPQAVAAALGWLLSPLPRLLASPVAAVQDRPRLAVALRYALYIGLLAWLAALLAPYLISVFTTEDGARPWRVFTDIRTWLFLWDGAVLTVEVSAIAILLSLVIGTLFALARLSKFPLVHWPAVAYIEVVRALPVFLMIILVHLQSSRVAAGLGFSLSESWAVILALTIYTVAVNAEIVRAGILSIDRGQTEAARSLGLSYVQMMWWVILPQALQRMVPPLVSQFITLLKDTSLGAVIGLLELLRRSEIIYRGMYAGTMNNNPIQAFLVVAVIYFVMCYLLSLVSLRMERQWARAR